MDFVSDALFNGKRFLLITVEGVFTRKWLAIHINQVLKGEVVLICPLLSGPISVLELATKEEWNGAEAQAGRYHRQVA